MITRYQDKRGIDRELILSFESQIEFANLLIKMIKFQSEKIQGSKDDYELPV